DGSAATLRYRFCAHSGDPKTNPPLESHHRRRDFRAGISRPHDLHASSPEVSMRRILTGLTALAVCAYPLPLLASAPPEEPPAEGEEELILDEEDMEAVPDEPTETGPADTSFLDDGDDKDVQD